jgi:hypothetical protein
MVNKCFRNGSLKLPQDDRLAAGQPQIRAYIRAASIYWRSGANRAMPKKKSRQALT